MNNIVPQKSYKSNYLKDYIENIHFYSFDKNIEPQTHTILPEGYFELIFQFGEGIEYKNSNKQNWQKLPTAFIGGLHSRSFKIKTHKNSQFISVCFKKGKAKHFIPNQLDSYKNQSIPTCDILLPNTLQDIKDILYEKNYHIKVELLEHFLMKNFRKYNHSPIEDSIQFIIEEKGILTVEKLAQHSKLSVSQFRNRFCKEIGISPKEFTKIIRLNSLINDYSSQRSKKSLTMIAYKYGYFDQSHFIKDFKSLASSTPKKYLKSFEIK